MAWTATPPLENDHKKAAAIWLQRCGHESPAAVAARGSRMQAPIFDSHAHLIFGDWGTYPPSPMRGVSTWTSMPCSVIAESLLAEMNRHGVSKACIVQRGHVYGYDNRYIIDRGKRYSDRFIPVVILDAQNPDTPAYLREIVEHHGVRKLRLAQSSPFHMIPPG
jgi:predicted TIM-barrel fold metal-dependent hydrolase